MKLKFPRFLLAQMTVSQDITRGKFGFVPAIGTERQWTDSELYAKYNLNEKEINFIEKTIMDVQ